MVWTIAAATMAFLLGVWVASRYGTHVSLRNREVEQPAAEKARILSKQELDWTIIHIRNDLGLIAAL